MFLRERLLILPFLPDSQNLSNLPLLPVQQNALGSCLTPEGYRECHLVYPECPENAPSHTILLQQALHSSLCRSGGKGQREKLQRSGYLRPHIQPCSNLIRFLSCQLAYLFCAHSPAQRAFRLRVLTLGYGIQTPSTCGPC